MSDMGRTKKKVCIVGSGNWGSAIAKIVGANTVKFNNKFEERVTMYVYEEMINGRKLTEIINQEHENVKYLPGHKLPENVVAVPDLIEAAKDADFLIFVIPHQFIRTLCATMLGKIKPTAIGLSLIKGFDQGEGQSIELISKIIEKNLKIQCYVLMGANLANEVAEGKFCETTIGCKDKRTAPLLRDMIQTENFRVVVVEDAEAVEVCGALKNIVACAAGFVDGLGLGDNTKAAIIRLGLMEMVKFVDTFFGGSKLSTFFESCGVADLITTCYGGRNRRVCEQFVKTGKTIKQLEDELLAGQKLQGPATADEVFAMLTSRGVTEKFPLFTAVHRVCIADLKPTDLIDQIRSHPEHVLVSHDKYHQEIIEVVASTTVNNYDVHQTHNSTNKLLNSSLSHFHRIIVALISSSLCALNSNFVIVFPSQVRTQSFVHVLKKFLNPHQDSSGINRPCACLNDFLIHIFFIQ